MTQNNSQKKQLHDEYKSRINRVIDYIDENIEIEFSLENLSKRANFSKYHFHRIFHSITGESLFGFIQRVKIEKAAALLLANRKRTITDIAFDCGFSSSASFSRSFKNRFNMSATEWRKKNKDVYDDEAVIMAQADVEKYNNIRPEKIEIRNIKETTVAYVRYIGPYKGDGKLFENLYTKLFKWAIPRELVDPASSDSLVLYHDSIEITDENKLRISVCIKVPKDTPVSGEIGKMNFSGGKYACLRFKLGTQDYYHAWNWAFSEWMPSSGYQPDDRFSFEYYPHDQNIDCQSDSTTVDICIPVKPL